MDNNIPSQPTSPAGGEPAVQNTVIQPVAAAAQAQNPPMTSAERIGINVMATEFRQNYQNNFAPILAAHPPLETAIFWICREIDSLRLMGYQLNNILNSDNLMRRVATAAANGSRPPAEFPGPFDALPFNSQIFYMNLATFIVRYLGRNN
jgi:hypothetical protein